MASAAFVFLAGFLEANKITHHPKVWQGMPAMFTKNEGNTHARSVIMLLIKIGNVIKKE